MNEDTEFIAHRDKETFCRECEKIINALTKEKCIVTSKNDLIDNIIRSAETVIESPAKLWEVLEEKRNTSGKSRGQLTRKDITYFLYTSNNIAYFPLLTIICELYCNIPTADLGRIGGEMIQYY